jgi:hypothetical protein
MKENMETKTPKIALCLSGLTRNSFFCFPYIYQNFLNQGLDVDVFIHTWNDSPVIDLYNPKKYETENQGEILNLIRNQIHINSVKVEGNINNNISMYYSIKKCFDLVPDNYDVVIRCRFDLILENKINLKEIVNGILNKEYDIFIPGRIFNVGGYNDQLAIGSYSAMKIYSDCILHLSELANELKRWHPESFLGLWLDTNNLKIQQDDYDYRIVRAVHPIFSWPENRYNFKNI